jgi:hypothetical protein
MAALRVMLRAGPHAVLGEKHALGCFARCRVERAHDPAANGGAFAWMP